MVEVVHYTRQDEIAVIPLDDGKANVFGTALIEQLGSALDRAALEARAVVVLGRPGVLSCGFDLNVMRSGDAAAAMALRRSGGRLLMRVFGHPQPVVIAATGHGIALGAFFLLTGDDRIGAPGAFRIGLNEVAIGAQLPEFAVALAQSRLSKRHLSRAILGGTLYDPEAAVGAGFLDEVAATAEALPAAAIEHARKLAAFDAATYAGLKRRLRAEIVEAVAPSLE
jgi:enoyl-CoA hydratase